MGRLVGVAVALGGVIALAIAPAHATQPAARKATKTAKAESAKASKHSSKSSKSSKAKKARALRTSSTSRIGRADRADRADRGFRTVPVEQRDGKERTDPKYLKMPRDLETTPAHVYGGLSQAECEAELVNRQIDFVRESAASVLAPVRINGALRGVTFRSNAKASVRATSPHEIADCRLVLAMDDFAQILARHDIVEVRHYSMWRPPKNLPDGQTAKRHDGALALDTGRFLYATGEELDVDRDFHGAIDAKTCGDGAIPNPVTPEALALRAILCETVEQRLFNVVLTPNYNRPHKNHFHLEVTPGVSWFLVH